MLTHGKGIIGHVIASGERVLQAPSSSPDSKITEMTMMFFFILTSIMKDAPLLLINHLTPAALDHEIDLLKPARRNAFHLFLSQNHLINPQYS